MSEVKYSDLLTTIIEHSKELAGAGSATLTAEKLLASVIDLMEMESFVRENQQEIEPVLELRRTNLTQLKDGLLKYAGGQGSSLMDGLYLQKKLIEAKKLAQDSGDDTLRLNVVLKCILADPSEAIRRCVSGERAEEEETAETEEEKRQQTAEQVSGFMEQWRRRMGASQEPDDRDEEEDLDEGLPVREREREREANPKASVSRLTDRVKDIQRKLLESVFGQDNAVNVFATGYFRAELLSMTDKKRVRPRATFLFAGPPGVGKTFLAEKAAEVLKLPFMRFDMSEYADKEANLEFCGSDKVYKNGKEGNVTSFVAEHPKCILLFDEIEKAHLVVIHLFLQLLDAGRLRDNYTDKEVSFADAIIIFTTNAGKQLYEESESGDYSTLSRKVILKALQRDTNPDTGAPYFPAAMCSRFASGNVVMFNHISAHDLRGIARREVLRHAHDFADQVGIRVDIDEDVFTALLFAEGGGADARMIRGRAESFFDDELFELFRMIDSDEVNGNIQDVESIHIGIELPEDQPALRDLFESESKYDVMLFAPDETAERCRRLASEHCRFSHVHDAAEAGKEFRTKDIQLVVIDLSQGGKRDQRYLNIEDVDSPARSFFWFIREEHPDVPVFLLQSGEFRLNEEEKNSYLSQGVRGILTLTEDGKDFAGDLERLCAELHQQGAMESLARTNKLVSFKTAQSLSEDGKRAEIVLFDFRLTMAVEAEDARSILSNATRPDVRFDQVIGAEDAKSELKYFVQYLKDPKRYLGTGVRAPRGVLLYGPPGTGKTMLAKAMAGECGVTFLSAEGNQFLKKYVGEGPEKVHELFRTARKYAPSILFIDEIDAIAKKREGSNEGPDSEETLTALLTEMDGFKNNSAKPVFVLAATNFNAEPGQSGALDEALLRRFDRRIFIDLPDREGRAKYMRMKLKNQPAFEISEEKLDSLAMRSTGMSLADLESIFELALRSAIRNQGLKVTDEILDEAFETFHSGENKKWDASQLERVARHEAGHTLLCWLSGETPSYLTIVARGNHGGYMQHADNEGKAIYTKDELLARIRTSLGGRAAELVYYGDRDGISTGASGDLATATNVARQIICTYGMDESFGLSVIESQAMRMGELSDEVREAVNRILADEMKRAVAAVSTNRHLIDALVKELMDRNHMTGAEIEKVFAEAQANA